MLPVPPQLERQFEDRLHRNAVPKEAHGFYKKWLRYYLDFCQKYQFPAQRRESLSDFLGKLEEKRQSKAQQEQAACAIGFFYEISGKKPLSEKPPMGPGGTAFRKRDSERVKQGFVSEVSSKLWGDQHATAQDLPLAERLLLREGAQREREHYQGGTRWASRATPVIRHTADVVEKTGFANFRPSPRASCPSPFQPRM